MSAPAATPASSRMTPRPPRPPRRAPRAARPPLTLPQAIARGILVMVASLIVAFLTTLVLVGNVSYHAAQQQLTDRFRGELAGGTAPVSEGDYLDVLLPDGAPVAIIDIPQIGLYDTVVEGTSSGVLMSGPGHRRDSVLPGQRGVSVLMGRALAYGGPFGGLSRLAPGDRFSVTTGQGAHTFEVMGTRYAGDPAPSNPRPGESRLILMTARGGPLTPVGVQYLDAVMVGESQPAGVRQTTRLTLPVQDAPLATDTRTVWALIFSLQLLVAGEIGAVWSLRRFGWRKSWVVFFPLLVLASLLTATQVAFLLPNLI
ncbi:sortase [Microbacterium sp. SORGH_AS_0862]|uniref:sortase n=1 Tax=Microbacterium sp. SORGH_AS_0862 TaxID=3041789 RepID=UPI0027920805|nr:sortase [Microbacterium sp. SORGH_AS_0862]MDQ1203952.1 sortase A [Microbacterium sp. SORGH_AS_0862]